MAGGSRKDAKSAAAQDAVKTVQRIEAKSKVKAAGAKAAQASKPEGSGDSPKRQGDKLEKARDAAAGKARR